MLHEAEKFTAQKLNGTGDWTDERMFLFPERKFAVITNRAEKFKKLTLCNENDH